MPKATEDHAGASASYVEQGWDSLTDDQLLLVQWSTDDPTSLPNVHPSIPANLGEFQIELAYDLAPEDAAVPCAHCPQHQPHRHGFVLRDAQGRRFLLGSTCGPKAYGTDYRLASNARTRTKRRYDVLTRWLRLRDELPAKIEELASIASSGQARVLRAGRNRLEQDAPRTVAKLRALRPSDVGSVLRMVHTTEARDDDAEEAVMSEFLVEVGKLMDLGLNNHEYTRRHAQLKAQLGAGQPIMRATQVDHGRLQGADWIRADRCPSSTLADVVARLRGLAAIGQGTQDKATPRLSQLVRQANVDLEAAERCVDAIESAKEFFQPRHLSKLCSWLNGGINPPGFALASEAKWEMTENRRPPVAIDFTPFAA